jgi:hypothetical protein
MTLLQYLVFWELTSHNTKVSLICEKCRLRSKKSDMHMIDKPNTEPHCFHNQTNKLRGPRSTSELYRLIDRYLSTKFSANFCG